MDILDTTTRKLQIVTDAAATIDVVASYADYVAGATTATLGTKPTAITTATTTDVVLAPAASTVRNLKSLHARNKHATLAGGLTLQLNDNGTIYEIRREILQAGDHLDFVEGTPGFRSAASASARLARTLSADATGTNGTAAQPWFPANGAVAVAGNTTYYFTGILSINRAAGAVSHTTGLLFGGSATLTSIQWVAHVNLGDVETTVTSNMTMGHVATNIAVKAASTSATEAITLLLHGQVRINAAGTFIPQFIYSAAPGGAPTIKNNTYYYMEPQGSGSFTSQGTWT